MLKSLPNSLTLVRLVVALFFPFSAQETRLPIFILALATEFLDGFLARKLKATTMLGQILDPMADKTLFFCAGWTLVVGQRISLAHFIFLASRDLVVILACIVLLMSRRVDLFAQMKPRLIGKIATTLQFIFILDVLRTDAANRGFLLAAIAVSLIAACAYFYQFVPKILK